MKVRIKQVPSRYDGTAVWQVEIWRWYAPFWVLHMGHMKEAEALKVAQLLKHPMIVNIE